MPEEILRIVEAAITLSAAAVLVRQVVRWRRRRPRMLCPGRRTRWWPLNPTRWFLRFGCRYDLAGLPTDASGLTICPECGRRALARQRVAAGATVRVGPLAAAVLALSAAMVAVHAHRSGGLPGRVPTLALLALEHAPHRINPEPLRDELSDRVWAGELGPRYAAALSRALASHLPNDGVRGNADRAQGLLWTLWPSSQPALESAVASRDVQARIIAAGILQGRSAPPSDALLRASVENLRLRPEDLDWFIGRGRVSRAAEYLMAHANLAAPLVAEALLSDDPQQRLVAAGIAGFAGLERLLPLAAPILIEHLGDNDVEGDAKIAAPALFRFGPAAIPFLEPYCGDEDQQRRGLARAIVESIRHPQRPVHQMESPPPRISSLGNDPIRGLTLSPGVSDLSWPDERRRP